MVFLVDLTQEVAEEDHRVEAGLAPEAKSHTQPDFRGGAVQGPQLPAGLHGGEAVVTWLTVAHRNLNFPLPAPSIW